MTVLTPISDTVKVNGCRVNAEIDPGAAVSMISRDFAMTLTNEGAMLRQGANSLFSLHGYGQNPIRIRDEYLNVKIEAMDSTFQHNLFISDDTSVPLLLGLPAVTAVGVKLLTQTGRDLLSVSSSAASNLETTRQGTINSVTCQVSQKSMAGEKSFANRGEKTSCLQGNSGREAVGTLLKKRKKRSKRRQKSNQVMARLTPVYNTRCPPKATRLVLCTIKTCALTRSPVKCSVNAVQLSNQKCYAQAPPVEVSSSSGKLFIRIVNKSERPILLTPQFVVAKLCLQKDKKRQETFAEKKKMTASGGTSTQQMVLCSLEGRELSSWSPVMGQFKLNLGNLQNLVSKVNKEVDAGEKGDAMAKGRSI